MGALRRGVSAIGRFRMTDLSEGDSRRTVSISYNGVWRART